MMKKIYQKPEVTMEVLGFKDVITSSSMGNAGVDDWDNSGDSQDRDDFFQF